MPKITVSDAAKMFGIGRRTIQRHIAQGRLSCGPIEGNRRYIDLSELMRVYGEPKKPLPNVAHLAQPEKTQNDTVAQSDLTAIIEVQNRKIDTLLNEVAALRNEIHELKSLPPPKVEKSTAWQHIKAVFKPTD